MVLQSSVTCSPKFAWFRRRYFLCLEHFAVLGDHVCLLFEHALELLDLCDETVDLLRSAVGSLLRLCEENPQLLDLEL